MTLIRISLEYLHQTGTFTKVSSLNVKLLFSLSLYPNTSIIHNLFIKSVTKIHELDNHQGVNP